MCDKSIIILVFIYYVAIRESEGSRGFEERPMKLFTFNVLDDAIDVTMDMKIPFLKIPMKRKIDLDTGLLEFPTININPAALAFGAVVVLGGTIILPFVIKHYTKEHEVFRVSKYNAEFSTDALLDLGQQMLMNSNGFGGCPLRLACWASQKDFADPRAILSQIINNKLLSAMVNSSAVEDAMISGLHGRSCSSYLPCPLEERHVPLLMNNLAMLTNSHDIY